MKRYIFLIILMFYYLSSAFGQLDSTVKGYQKEFEQFKEQIEYEHQQFKNKNDSVFAKFLKDSWKEFDVLYNEVKGPLKPIKQPEFEKDEITEPFEIVPIIEDSTSSKKSSSNNIKKPVKEKAAPSTDSWEKATLDFDFYGVKTNVLNPGPLLPLKRIDYETIDSFFEVIANLDVIPEIVQNLRERQKKMRLNDWGYLKLVQRVASSLDVSNNRQILFSWILLLKSGYNVKAGYSGKEVFLLFPANEEISSSYFLTVNKTPYYILTQRERDNPLTEITTYEAHYPGSTALSLQLEEIPKIGSEFTEKEISFNNESFIININKELARFYYEYPFCEMDIYFHAPLSDNIIASLENILNPKLLEKNENEKIEYLLEFTQNAFKYKTDDEQFGREKYFFPDEVFYYPYSDCEDRSILFTKLVKHFTNRQCIGLDFPGHVNAAVVLDKEISGDYVQLGDSKYFVCDPTYSKAPPGYLDSKYKKFHPKIITVN